MIYELLFSATGRSENILDTVSSCWDGDKVRIDLSDPYLSGEKYNIAEDDFCIVNTSVIEGRIPRPAAENLKKLKGNGAKAFLVAVFGNRSIDDCLLEMKDIMTAQGFVPVAAAEISVQHSIINRVCADRPDADDIRQIKEFSLQVKNFAEKFTADMEIKVPGKFPYIEMGGVAFKPAADEKCIGCGLCAEKCPVLAIPADNPQLTDRNKCITCLRCVEICPVQSRKIPQEIAERAYNRMKDLFAERKPNRLYLAE